jgi:hypothetical protein
MYAWTPQDQFLATPLDCISLFFNIPTFSSASSPILIEKKETEMERIEYQMIEFKKDFFAKIKECLKSDWNNVT